MVAALTVFASTNDINLDVLLTAQGNFTNATIIRHNPAYVIVIYPCAAWPGLRTAICHRTCKNNSTIHHPTLPHFWQMKKTNMMPHSKPKPPNAPLTMPTSLQYAGQINS